jgi:hypothetical protein
MDPIDKDKAKLLYDAGAKHYDLGSFDEFVVKLESPEKRKLLYDNLSEKFDLGTYEEYETKLKKKGPSFTEQTQQMLSGFPAAQPGEASSKSISGVDVRTAGKKYNWDPNVKWTPDMLEKAKQSTAEDEDRLKEEKKKKLVDFYDKAQPAIDAEVDVRTLYKNWSADNGSLDRYNYLHEQAQYESQKKKEELGVTAQGIKDLQEQRRQAATAGDLETYSKLNEMINTGVDQVRKNKAVLDGPEGDPRTETGLKIWEESVGFASDMLNAKMETLMAKPEVKQKLTRLESIYQIIGNDAGWSGSIADNGHNPELINEYNSILQDEDIAQVNKLSKYGTKILDSEKEFAIKFPNVFQERISKKEKQEQVDRMFEKGERGLWSGVRSQVGRSATGFLSDMAKLPAIVDFDNKYGWQDKWDAMVDSMVGYVDDEALPIPSDYNKPLMYEDQSGNTVWRSDLIIPKTARVAGDMAALIFGAGKISKLGSAIGLSKKVSAGIGLFSSSFVQSHDDYKKSAMDAGMNPSDASWFATTAAATTSALELISPNKYMWGGDDIAKRVASNIATGMSRKAAMSESLKFFGKELLGENAQEISQSIGDLVVETGANKLTGNDYFEHNAKDLINEAIETITLTSIVAGAPAGAVATSRIANRESNYKDAIHIVAENRDKYLPLLQASFKESGADPAYVKKVMADIDAVKTPHEGAPLYKVDGETVSRADIEEKIKTGDLKGVYVANDTHLEAQLKSVATGEKLPEAPKAEPIKEEKKETVDGKVKEESPEDKAKKIAKGKIEALVATGDLKWDGKRATVLTEKGGQQLASIMDELNRTRSGIKPPVKSESIPDRDVHKSGVSTEHERTQNVNTSQKPVHIPEKSGHLIEGENLDLNEYVKSEKDPEAKRIATVLSKAKTTLSAIKPVKVAMYKGAEQGAELLKKIGSAATPTKSTAGFYDRDSGVIGIDMSQADGSTAFHEAFHPIVDFIKTEKPEVFQQLSDQASNVRIELEDGSVIKYGEYTNGNKEEALVEFLADFADGKFDSLNDQKSIIQSVKDFINKILETTGLKASDFKVNLNNIKSLKSFADQMATAVSQGKTINFGAKTEVKETGTVFQNKGKRKLNRTAKRIAFDRATEFKDLQVDIVKNPDEYSYDPQKYSDIEQFLEAQTDADLFSMLSVNNSMSVLAGIKLLRRYNAAGTDTRPVFKKLREIGTGVGQLLRQFGELKNNTPEGIVQMVLKNLESLNLTLTQDQLTDLQTLADAHIKSLNDTEAKRVAFIQSPSKQTEDALKKADQELAKSFAELNTFIGKVTPVGVDSMIATILQGNLLTPKSIVVNVISNFIQQPLRQIELAAGDLATYMVHRFKGIDMANPLEMWYGATVNGIQQSTLGVGRAAKDVVKGRGAEYTSTLEVRRNLKPLQSLQQIFTREGRASLPVNTKGNVPLSVYIEKAFEGTAGWPAEAMFRMLYLGDKPFKDGARMAGAYRMFSEQGGGTNAEFRRFMANLTPAQNKVLQEYSDEATFSNDRTLSKIADGFVGWVNKNIEILAEKSPNESFKHASKVLLKVIAKANTPFVRVPSNLLQYLIELAIPAIPLYGSIQAGVRGNPRKSAQLFVRGMAGISMTMMADMLYDAGVILASGEDDDDNERQLKHEIGRPNGINIDAFARFRNGGDAQFKEGDRVVDFSKLGVFGMFMAYRAEFNESVEKELKKSRHEVDLHTRVIEQLNSVAGSALEMSFMQGTYNMFQALEKGGFQDYGAELMNTLTAVAIPNTVSAVTRARAPYVLRADDKEAFKEFMEKQSVKLFPSMEDNITGVYPIIGMFGDPATQHPKKGTFGDINPFLHQFFDITNGEAIEDPVALEVFNLSKRVGEIPISAPTPKVRIMDKPFSLTEQDYTYLQMMAGRYKRLVLQYEISQPEWKEYSDEEKAMALHDINETANSESRDQILGMIYEGIESGRIILDEKMGTYSYTQPSEFDFDFAKKLLE